MMRSWDFVNNKQTHSGSCNDGRKFVVLCEMLQGRNLHGVSALQDGEEAFDTIAVGVRARASTQFA